MPFPGGTAADRAYPRGFDDLANAIYKLGEERPELFHRTTDPGGTAIKQSLAQLLGIPVDHYVMVDMRGVVETVDLFGGIDLTLTEAITDGAGPIEPGGPPLNIDAEPGRHHFDGLTTLAYARARQQSSDYSRMSRQRCVIEALVDQVSVLEVVRHYDDLRSIMVRHVTTDIPVDELPTLLEMAERLDTERITTVNLVPPTFPSGAAPVELVREAVEAAFDGSATASVPVGTGLDAITGAPGPSGQLLQRQGVQVPWPDHLDDPTSGLPRQPVVPWPDRLDDPTTGIKVAPFVPWPDRLDALGTSEAGSSQLSGRDGDGGRSSLDSRIPGGTSAGGTSSPDTIPPATQELAEACGAPT
jgi:LCP family protein required for cell wall assembly